MAFPNKPSTQKNTANQKAYTYYIVPKNSGIGEDHLVHQMSPTWVLTFVRWEYRDLLRTKTSTPDKVREPLVVENDCVSLSVTHDKGNLTPSCNMVLKETDVNYETEIAPGDFVFVNMLDWEEQARRVANNARGTNREGSIKPINGVEDGFKGIFKVQSVRKSVEAQPGTGVKTVIYRIDGFAFTEFNNTLYFNPNLVLQQDLQNQGLFINDIAPAWSSFISKNATPYVQEILAFLIQNFIGTANNGKALNTKGLVATPNQHFKMPTLVGRLLGVTADNTPDSNDFVTTIAAKDIYSYLFGIQQYNSNPNQKLCYGMNPSNGITERYPRFTYTKDMCIGNTTLKPEFWNQVKLWSVMQQYTNSPINELYTTFKVDYNNRIMPTVIFRQIPFTSEDFVNQQFGTPTDQTASAIEVTKFLSVPRWKIDSAYVFNFDLGRDEAARINWVQYYGLSVFGIQGIDTAQETARHNYVFDKDDVERSGLRSYIVQNQFDDLVSDRFIINSPIQARILGDALIGGQLKMNGTINCIGIKEPISVGDNLEFDGVVYHIEQVSHSCAINMLNGIKNFRTTLKVSHGVSVYSNAEGTRYAEMANPTAKQDRIDDFKHEKILPGVSDSQDVYYRNPSLDVPTSNNREAFPQPSTTKNVPNKGK